MNGWESFKCDFARFVCSICAGITALNGIAALAWYLGYIKIACLGSMCGVLFK